MTGAENAIPTRTLVKLTGLSVRDLRAQVAREREAGALILAKGDGGYFLPDEGEKGRDELLRRFGQESDSHLSRTGRSPVM